MSAEPLVSEIKTRVSLEVKRLKREDGIEPKLIAVKIGSDTASEIYVNYKRKDCEKVGIISEVIDLREVSKEDTPQKVARLMSELNGDPKVNGVLFQMPFGGKISPLAVFSQLSPKKDVDGLTSLNLGKLSRGELDDSSLIPCTPRGVMELLHYYKIPIKSSRVVIINRSNIVGKPLYHLLLSEDATVTICHSQSTELASVTKQADILVTAVGKRPQFTVTSNMVKEGAAVIDVAMNRIDGKLVGDVDFEEVSKKTSYITPVPGGVGPMTRACLLENTLIATLNQRKEGIIGIKNRKSVSEDIGARADALE